MQCRAFVIAIIEGTSDAGDRALNNKAAQFARRYNEVVKQHLQLQRALSGYLDCRQSSGSRAASTTPDRTSNTLSPNSIENVVSTDSAGRTSFTISAAGTELEACTGDWCQVVQQPGRKMDTAPMWEAVFLMSYFFDMPDEYQGKRKARRGGFSPSTRSNALHRS